MQRTIIIGGGIVGSVLAVFLARRGHPVEVFERYAQSLDEGAMHRPQINITLCERGFRALEKIGLRKEIQELTVAAHGRHVHQADGTVAYQPYGEPGEAIYSIARSTLNDALVKCAMREPGVRIHFNQRCIDVDLNQGTARFEDTRDGRITEVGDAPIFAADGAYSGVRARMQKREQFNYSQQYWKQRGYKSLRMPPRKDGSPVLRNDGLHVWPRGNGMLIGFPNQDGSINCSLMLPLHGEDSFDSLSSAEALQSFFRSSFPDAVDLLPGLAEDFLSRPANSLLTVKCSPWSHEGRVLLIGDAAHAVLPSYGQGANAGFEDCAILDDCIAAHGASWRDVFLDFEQRRRPSMDAMADLCVEHFEELFDLVGDPNFLRRREIERRVHELHPDLYRPLYSMIAFSSLPYDEALRVDRRQRLQIDRIMRIDGVEEKLDSPEVRHILASSSQRPPSLTPAPSTKVGSDLDAQPIMDLTWSFWGAKALLSAVELGVFSKLRHGPLSGADLARATRLHSRGASDFLDTLVALGVLHRDGDFYANTALAMRYLVPGGVSYVGGALELANSRLYPVWGKLTEALRTGQPQNEAKQEKDYYSNLTGDQDRLGVFLRGMSGLSMMASQAIARKFPWKDHETFVDIGGAEGGLSIELARTHSHLKGATFELPAIEPYFSERVTAAKFNDRLRFISGDFFQDPLPQADVLIMGHVLHNWGLAKKRTLIRKAFDALPPGGALVIYEALIDDSRSTNAFGLLMSLNMLLVTSEGFVFTGEDCSSWLHEAGFSEVRIEHLHGADSMVIGIK